MAFIRCDTWCCPWRSRVGSMWLMRGLCPPCTARQLGSLRGGACPGCSLYKVTGKTQAFPLQMSCHFTLMQGITRTRALDPEGSEPGWA